MTIATINVSEEHSQYVGQVYQEHYAKLRHYFRMQLGNSSQANDCAHETMRRFFFFMEERCWEAEAEYVPVYLMRIAGFLCSRKLAEKRVWRRSSRLYRSILDRILNNSMFNKVKNQAAQTFNVLAQTKQLLLRPVKGDVVSEGF